VDPRTIGQPRVDDRRRAVGPQPQRRNHALDQQVDRRALEHEGSALEPSRPLDPHGTGPVDEDVGHARVGEQRLERAQAADAGTHARHDARHLLGGEQRRLAADEVGERRFVEWIVARGHEHAMVDPRVEGGPGLGGRAGTDVRRHRAAPARGSAAAGP
jgi:hypothetical protein